MKPSVPLAASVIAMVGGLSAAGPLNSADIPSGATWVVHVDVERLASSPTISTLIQSGSIDLDLDDVHQEFGLDPLTDILGVTISGMDRDMERPAIVIEATEALDRALQELEVRGDAHYHKIQEGTRTIHVIEHEGRSWYGYVSDGRRAGTRVLRVAEGKDALIESILRAGQAQVGGHAAVRHGGPGAGSIVYLSLDHVPIDDNGAGPASFLLRSTSTITLDLGEKEGSLTAVGAIDTVDPTQAANVIGLAQGLIAAGRIAMQHDPEAVRFMPVIDKLNVWLDGSTLRARAEVPGELIRTLLEEEQRAATLKGPKSGARSREQQLTEAEVREIERRVRARVEQRERERIEREIERQVREEIERAGQSSGERPD